MKLKEIAKIEMGQSPKGDSYNNKRIGKPFLQGNRTFGRIFPNIDTWTTEPKKIAKSNSVLMSVRAPVGDLNIANQEICIGRGLCSIEMNNSNNQFLYYLLKNSINELKRKSTGTVFDSINRKNLEELEVKDFSDVEQIKIAQILGILDKKIELNNQINDNLYEIELTLFKEFVKQNRNSSEKIDLKDCVKKIGTGADAIQKAPIVNYDTGVRCIRVGDMTNNRKYYEWGFTEMTHKDFENYKLDFGDIVVTRTAVNGITKIIDNNEKIVCNNGLIRLKVNNKYNPLYIYLCTKTKDFYDYIHRIDSETSVRPNMKVDYFTSYKIYKISLEKQNEFCNKIDSIFKLQKELDKETRNLEQLRDTLLPKLMNGEIDLDNAQI